MTELKRGDRVKVEYEGVYDRPNGPSGGHWVNANGLAWAPSPATLTKIVEPLKVGDKVSGDDFVDRLPVGGIARPVNRPGQWSRVGDSQRRSIQRTGPTGWQQVGRGGYLDASEVREFGPAVVIYLP